MTDEQKIIQRCQKGDYTEFTKLYDGYFEKIYQFIYFKTLHRETAEDLTSLTFLKALEKIPSYQKSMGNFSSWLFTIARNNITDYYRTHHPHANIDDYWQLANPSQPIDQQVSDRIEVEKVRKLLANFSAEIKDLLIMRLWQELSYREISQITGKTPDSLKMAFSRAIKKLSARDLALIISLISLTC